MTTADEPKIAEAFPAAIVVPSQYAGAAYVDVIIRLEIRSALPTASARFWRSCSVDRVTLDRATGAPLPDGFGPQHVMLLDTLDLADRLVCEALLVERAKERIAADPRGCAPW